MNDYLESEWHPTKNGDLRYADLTPGMATVVHWLGECGHEWSGKFFLRATRGAGCPFCSNRQVLAGFNDLATVHPELAAEWHPTLNGDLTPATVVAGGAKSYHWLGECGHDWSTTIKKRVAGSGCPVCAGLKVVAGVNDLASRFPEIAAQWHPTKNGKFTPETAFHGATANRWWLCEHGHEWRQTIRYRTENNSTCKDCPDIKTVSLLSEFPEIAAQWHPTKNGALTPEHVTPGSTRVMIWWLGECGHEWEASSYTRTTGGKCAVCLGAQIQVGVNDFAFLQPELAKEWHPTKNGEVTPKMIVEHSNKSRWWLGKCGHEWDDDPAHRVSGRGCPVCSNYRVVAGINDLQTAHPHLMEEWHPTKNSDIDPAKIPSGGGRHKAWWVCKHAHEWYARIAGRVNGKGCPSCSTYVSQAEHEVYKFVSSILPESESARQSDRSLLRNQELDIYVPSRNIAIEFNGLWWHNEEIKPDIHYHEKKWQRCVNEGVQLIQIWEDEWRDNPEFVKRMLQRKLNLTTEERVGARKTRVREVEREEAVAFLNANHIQGFSSASHYVGLVRRDNDELVALLTLKRQGEDAGLDIVRYATSAHVIGGFTKALAWAEKQYQPKQFVTFSDHCVSDGKLYEKNGFTADKVLPADFRYVVDGERKHKFGYRTHRFESDPNLLFEAGMTEKELAALNGLKRIWDAGKTRWVKTLVSEAATAVEVDDDLDAAVGL